MRNRILGLEYVRADEIEKHPENWRVHPERQKRALRGAMARIGSTSALIAYRHEGRLRLVDGHLRRDLAGDEKVAVLVTDLTEAEAREALATHDVLGGMADADAELLADLAESLEGWDDGDRLAISDEWDELIAQPMIGVPNLRAQDNTSPIKFEIRRRALARRVDGAILVAFCGLGVCATEAEYPIAECVAVDEDPDCTGDPIWRRAKVVITDDANTFDVPPCTYSFLDLDPYANPFPALRNFFGSDAAVTDPCQLVLTLNHEYQSRQSKKFDFDTLRYYRAGFSQVRRQRARFVEEAAEWISSIAGGAVEVVEEAHSGKHTKYAWLVLRGCSPTRQPAIPKLCNLCGQRIDS